MDKTQAPKNIAVAKGPPGLMIEWEDGLKRKIPFITLRKECPCAECRGERTPLDLAPDELPTARPLSDKAAICQNMYKIGGYAVGFVWGDGHDSGIYSWEYLRALAEGIDD